MKVLLDECVTKKLIATFLKMREGLLYFILLILNIVWQS